MSFTNNYRPPSPPPPLDLARHLDPAEPYDINFAFPLHAGALESARVRLTPFVPALHARTYFAEVEAEPATQRWLPFTHASLEEVCAFVEHGVRRNPGWILFAVLDKGAGEGERMAGVIGLVNTSAANLAAEIGWVVTFAAFRRTYVTTHAVGLLLRYCLSPRTARGTSPPGLGLRRVWWTAHPSNAPSLRAARRVGMRVEGTQRWAWVLPAGKEGNGVEVPRGREAEAEKDGEADGEKAAAGRPGRDSVVLAVCWDDWEQGGSELVRGLMERA